MNARTKAVSGEKAVKKKQHTSAWRVIANIFKILFIAVFSLCVIAGGIVGGAVFAWIKTAEPITPDQLMLKGFTTYVYDSANPPNIIIPLQGIKNREMADSKDIPQNLKDAFIAIEDKRFKDHPGVDFKRFGSAVINFVVPIGSSHGGSTITQQVVKNLTGQDQRSVKRKIQEAWRALELERNLTKDQVLELYMNLIYMGENCYGVQSAAKTYFNKDVKDLTLAECASLAGITNLPGKYDPLTTKGRENNIERQKIILQEMLDLEFITQKEYDEAIKEELVFADSNKRSAEVTSNQPYFVDQVILDVKRDLIANGYSEELAIKTIYNNGLKIYTTMDSQVQKAMDEVFQDEKYFTKVNKNTSQSPQAAMVIIDPETGQVKAMYGGAGPKIGSPLNRASSSIMKRQPGSTFKPIAVYGPSINERLITSATVIDDVPSYLQGLDKGIWPRNYGGSKDFSGLTTIRNGLKRSINVIAAKVWIDYLQADLSLEYLDRVNINRDKERYPAIAMGAPYEGVNPLQMAAAYVPFVSKGMYYEPITYTKVEDMKGKIILEKKPKFNIVYDEAAAYVMVDMMKEVVTTGGTAAGRGQLQSGKMPTAGKTGTTSDNKDKWFVGYSPYYVGAAWYGYDRPVTIHRDEQNRAQILWHDVMEKIHEGLEPVDFEQPPGIVKKPICIYSGKVPSDLCYRDPRGHAVRDEIFIQGTEPDDEDTCDVHVLSKVCKDSQDIYGRNLLAGDYCPIESIMEQVFTQRREPYAPVNPNDAYPRDWKYEIPAGEYCNIHGPETDNIRDDTLVPSLTDWLNDLFH